MSKELCTTEYKKGIENFLLVFWSSDCTKEEQARAYYIKNFKGYNKGTITIKLPHQKNKNKNNYKVTKNFTNYFTTMSMWSLVANY